MVAQSFFRHWHLFAPKAGLINLGVLKTGKCVTFAQCKASIFMDMNNELDNPSVKSLFIIIFILFWAVWFDGPYLGVVHGLHQRIYIVYVHTATVHVHAKNFNCVVVCRKLLKARPKIFGIIYAECTLAIALNDSQSPVPNTSKLVYQT